MIRYLILTGFLLCGLIARSQAPVSQFSASVTEGCSPLVITFKDLSTGNPKSWNWDLGNGQLSTQQNPITSYYTPGKYTVRLVVRNADGTDGLTKTDYITVFPAPTADFSADFTNVCLPGKVQFTDKTANTVGTINKWEWDFGDGTNSPLQAPQKTYTANGFYTVSLKVTSTTGCTSVSTKPRYIRVLSGITPDFSYAVDSVCRPPFNTTFANLSSGPGTVSYTWNFGNGDVSASPSPSGSYTAPGTYRVLLVARSEFGCVDSVTKNVTVTSVNTAFSNADSACVESPVSFRNTSAPAPVSSLWNFGDGTGSPLVNPSKSYTAPGTYQVKVVNKYATCTDSLTRPVKILTPPVINFSSNVQGGCKAPLAVNFQDLSPDAVSSTWNFGDGATGTGKSVSHTYTRTGEFDVTLTITNAFGCKNTDTRSKYIRVLPPSVAISNAPTGGCIPFTFTPAPNVQAVDGVASYLWDYGEGGGWTSAGSYTYTKQGNFPLKLKVTTQGGCSDSVTVTNGISAGTAPLVDFKADTIQDCADSVIYFHDLSTPSGPVLWDLGDGTTSTLKDPTHKYENPGPYTITLTTTNNGCSKSLTRNQYITVLPPRPSFLFQVNCTDKLTVSFQDQSVIDATKPVSYFWQFGEPQLGSSTQKNPSFTFPAQGYYVIKLTVTNGECTNTLTYPISFSREKADFSISPSDSLCRSQTFTFSAVNSIPQNISQYQWSLNGGAFTPGGSSITARFDSNGTIPVRMFINDRYGCSDTISKSVIVTGPYPDFTTADTTGCENALVTFRDLSTPVGEITSWRFDFGDGTSQTYSRPPFTHQYKTAGSYNVTLTVQGRRGCSIGITKNNLVRISKPVVAFKAQTTVYCPGSDLQFTDSSFGVAPLSYLWKFGDGSTSTLQHPTHAYAKKDTIYSVSLKVQDAAGCSDSLTKVRYIQVRVPNSAFDVKDSVAICPPLETKFFFKGSGYESFYWDFGDTTESTLMNPTHFYNTYGTYTAKLVLKGFGGCPDSSIHVINLYDPTTASLTVTPLSACNSVLADLTIKRPPNTTFSLYFGDGEYEETQKDTVQHFYSAPGHYSPSISLSDKLGCQVSVASPKSIDIRGASPFFSPDRKSFCDSGKVFFTNFTIGNDPIVSNVWDFGDGSTSTETEPVHNYSQPGLYLPSLTVSTQIGCTKTVTDTIRVYATPAPFIIGDSAACLNSPLALKGDLARADSTVTWNWNFGNGQSSTLQNPTVAYNTSGRYTITLVATNVLGCKQTVTKTVTVNPLPTIVMQDVIVIPAGAGLPVPVTYSPGVTAYNWAPAKGLSCTECAVPVANPGTTTRYTVTATDINKCVSTEDITITVACNDNNFFVPNTFSPNGDGSNDVFYPRGAGVSNVQSMRIFNRWGQMVYERRNFPVNNQSSGWNGTYGNQFASADTYVYIIEFTCANGELITYKGNVTLIR